jgi:hypothetical protein
MNTQVCVVEELGAENSKLENGTFKFGMKSLTLLSVVSEVSHSQ